MRKNKMNTFISLLLLFSSCSYQTNIPKINKSHQIKQLHIPLVETKLSYPRIEFLATQSLIKSCLQQGIKIVPLSKSDFSLEANIKNINFHPLEKNPEDTLETEKFLMKITLKWQIKEVSSGKIILQNESEGTSKFYRHQNLEISRANALPHSLGKASNKIANQIANQF